MVGGVRVDLEFRVLAWHELLLIVPRIALDRRTNGGLREKLVRLRMHIHSPISHHESAIVGQRALPASVRSLLSP